MRFSEEILWVFIKPEINFLTFRFDSRLTFELYYF